MQNHPNVFTAVVPLSLFVAAALATPALAGTLTLQATGGGAWTGTSNTCTYTGLTADGSGNLTVTCQASGSGSGSGSGSVVNGTCGSQKGGTFSTTPSGALCGTGTASTVQLSGSQYSWTCTGSGTGHTDASCTANYQAVAAGACPATPTNITVQPWTSYANSSNVLVQVIPVGTGLSLQFQMDEADYPDGFKLSDQGSGSKVYSFSRCPGGTDNSTAPILGQNGTASVNGDAMLDNCTNIAGGYMRPVDTSGATAVFYAGANLSIQKTCFLPTTTTQGNSTPATYYLNIINKSTTTDASIQYRNLPQPN
jgi:hypothetical protein